MQFGQVKEMAEGRSLPDEPQDGGLNEWSAHLKALIAAGASPDATAHAKAITVKLEREIVDRARDWVLHPPPNARTLPTGKETILLYPRPGLFDLDGWRQHLEWLRTEPQDIVARADAIERAEDWIAMLETPAPSQRPPEAD